MPQPPSISAALSLDGLGHDARAAFDLAAANGFRGIAFATNHAELSPAQLGATGRRHVRSILESRGLSIDAIRAAAPRSGLADPATIDRTLDNIRRTMTLARELGVSTVAVNIGPIGGKDTDVPEATVVSALRELAQQADAAGLTLALGAEGLESLGRVLKDVDYEHARVNLDTARAIASAEDPLKLTEALAGRIGLLTAADAVRAGRSVRAAMLGEGQLPLPELLSMLEEQGFRGPRIVDVRDLPDGAAGARHAAEVLRHLL